MFLLYETVNQISKRRVREKRVDSENEPKRYRVRDDWRQETVISESAENFSPRRVAFRTYGDSDNNSSSNWKSSGGIKTRTIF